MAKKKDNRGGAGRNQGRKKGTETLEDGVEYLKSFGI